MFGKVPPFLTSIFALNQSRYSAKVDMPNPRIDLFRPSLVYSASVLWNLLSDSLSLPSSSETLKSRYVIHYALTGWHIAC